MLVPSVSVTNMEPNRCVLTSECSPMRRARRFLIALAIALMPLWPVWAQRTMQADKLAYPVLITFDKGNGSGFFVNMPEGIFLVTAKHVLFKKDDQTLNDNQGALLSYSSDPDPSERNILEIDFGELNKAGLIKVHKTHDIAVVKIGALTPHKKEQTGSDYSVTLMKGIHVKEKTKRGLGGVVPENIRTFDKVFIGMR